MEHRRLAAGLALLGAFLMVTHSQRRTTCDDDQTTCANDNISTCKVGNQLRCCPGAYLNLTYHNDDIISCNCIDLGSTTGFNCSGVSSGSVISASWLTCSMVMLVTLASLTFNSHWSQM